MPAGRWIRSDVRMENKRRPSSSSQAVFSLVVGDVAVTAEPKSQVTPWSVLKTEQDCTTPEALMRCEGNTNVPSRMAKP